VHILQPTFRTYYNLEEIWGGKPVRLKAATPAPAAKKAVRKVATKAAAGTARKTATRRRGV